MSQTERADPCAGIEVTRRALASAVCANRLQDAAAYGSGLAMTISAMSLWWTSSAIPSDHSKRSPWMSWSRAESTRTSGSMSSARVAMLRRG